VIKVKEREFLAAFKEVFVYQLRKKFGRSEGLSTVERYVRPLLILLYVLLLYVFTRNHYALPLTVLTFLGCAWLSAIAIDSIKRIYHRRAVLAGPEKGFREVREFTVRERIFTYLIPALVLTSIFAGGMFLLTFARTGEVKVQLFAGLLSIPVVLLYHLRADSHAPVQLTL
jgi:hypothetical protein